MSTSATTFPARFADLVYLLAHEPDAATEHEQILSAAASALASSDASLTTTQLNVDLLDEGQTKDGVQLHELVMRMSAHSAHQIDFLAKAPAPQILGVARILAGEATPNDDGAAFDAKLVAIGITHVEAHLGRNGFVRTGSLSPSASPRVGSGKVRVPTPFRGMPAYMAAYTPSMPQPALRIPTPPPAKESTRATPATTGRAVTPARGDIVLGAELPTAAAARRTPPIGAPSIRDDSSRMIEGAIRTKALASMSDDELARIRNQEIGMRASSSSDIDAISRSFSL